MLKRAGRYAWPNEVRRTDDRQRFLVEPSAGAVRCFFLTFRQGAQGREWLTSLFARIASRSTALSGGWWAATGFTCNGLQMLGVDNTTLAAFPAAFRRGMAARASELGDTGANHPACWIGGLARPDLHAILVISAANVAERASATREYEALVSRFHEVKVLSTLDLEIESWSTPVRDHFGVGHDLEFVSSQAGDAFGSRERLPIPSTLFLNSTFVTYRRLEQHAGAFRQSAHTRSVREAAQDPPPPGTVRRLVPYGPPLAEGSPDDGLERGIVTFDWSTSAAPLFSRSPHRIARHREIHAFTTLRGGSYFLLPGVSALRSLASLRTPSDLASEPMLRHG